MPTPLDHEYWTTVTARGVDLTVESGNCLTSRTAGAGPGRWFGADTTAIVGASSEASEGIGEATTAEWALTLDPATVHNFTRGFLVIACIRRFGGLHSTTYDKRVDVWLNGERVDGFGLRVVPLEHSDYFHRPALPGVPHITAFRDCQTVYAWPLKKSWLRRGEVQRVRVRVDAGVRWDIDYVALTCVAAPKPREVFLSHGWSDKPVARGLTESLEQRGVGVWLDEAEIGLGDSLIEKIRAAIDAVDVVAVLLSSHSIQSEWVKREVDVAMNQEIAQRRLKVLPIRLDDCELPGFLLGKLYAEMRGPQDYERVAAMIESQLARRRIGS